MRSKEQHVYDIINHNNIIIVPTVGFKTNEPPAKKPKLDSTPEKKDAEKYDTKAILNNATTMDAKESSITANSTCAKKGIKVHSWASSNPQSTGQQARTKMSESLTKSNMETEKQSKQVTQTNIAQTSNWIPINMYPNPLSYHFQMHTSIIPTPNACCSATSLNYNTPINYNPLMNYATPLSYATQPSYSAPQNYSAPVNYPNSFDYTAPSNYPTPTNNTAPINYNTPINFSTPANGTAPITNNTPLNYSTPANGTAPTSYNTPLNYATPAYGTAPISYNTPLNYATPANGTAPINYNMLSNYPTPTNGTAPISYNTPLTVPITPQKKPGTPLIDEPISPLSECTMPLNDSVTSIQYDPISSSSETTPTKLDNAPNMDTQHANSSKNEGLANDCIKMEKGTSKINISPRTKIKLNLIKTKINRDTKSHSVRDRKDKCKTRDRIRCDKDISTQSDKRNKRSDPTSSSKEKVAKASESKSIKTASKRKLDESHDLVKEPSEVDSKKVDRLKKRSSEHYKYQETEPHTKRDTREGKHTKHDYNKGKIIEEMKEIRTLCEKVKSTSSKKANVNKPSTSKIRKSRTPERLQRKRPRTDMGSAEKDKTKKQISLISVVQPVIKTKYPNTSPTCHSPERKDAGVTEHFDLRSKLSRANRYFQKNRYSKNDLKDHDNLVVTINQPEVNTEPTPKSPPKVIVTEKKIKSKNKKYKTIKFTIKVLCQDGEGSASSHSDDSEEELNTGDVASSQNDLSFLDDFNVDEIVDSLKHSQKRSVNVQNKNQSSHNKDKASKINNCAVSEPRIDYGTQVIQDNESNDCIIVEDTIKTENIKIEGKPKNIINESNDCLIIDTVEIGKVKPEVFDKKYDCDDCVILNASNITNIKTEQDNESNECMIVDNTLDLISIKSESSESVIDIKPNIKIKSETLEKSNDCIIVEIENHPIKIEDSINYIESDDSGVTNNTVAEYVKKEVDNIADENENVTNINGSVTIEDDNLNLLYDEDTMEIPHLAAEPMDVYEIKNTQGDEENTTNYCPPEQSATATLEHNNIIYEIPISTDTTASNVEKSVFFDVNRNEERDTADIDQDLSKSTIIFDAMCKANINVEEVSNIIKKEPTVILSITKDNIEIDDTIYNQDSNQSVHKMDTKVITEPAIVSPKEPKIEIEIIPTKNIEMNNRICPENKTVSEENTLTKSESTKTADATKNDKQNNQSKAVSKNLEPACLTKENTDSTHDDKTKKKVESKINVCESEGLTLEKTIRQEIINNIEPKLAHLKPKDSQAIINAVAAKAEKIINSPKSDSSLANSKDTGKVSDIVATKTVETEKRQVAIIKKNEGEELGEIKEQLEARMFEYLHERYTITSLIHEGRFSKIFKCNDSKNRNCALKLLKSPSDRHSKGVEKEDILQKIQKEIPKENLNIVMVIDGFGFERRWALLMEYYPIDLKTLLSKKKKGFRLDVLPGLAKQLIMAIMVLRNNQIVHSDIRPSHILLDESAQRLKLCGFDSCYYANTIEVCHLYLSDFLFCNFQVLKFPVRLPPLCDVGLKDIAKLASNLKPLLENADVNIRVYHYLTVEQKVQRQYLSNGVHLLGNNAVYFAQCTMRQCTVIEPGPLTLWPCYKQLLFELLMRRYPLHPKVAWKRPLSAVLPNIGKVCYRAPEIIMGFSASYSIDVWSAGTVLYEMFTKRKLFFGIFNNQVLFNQLCIMGDMPADMIQGSPFQSNHFDGLSFVRRYGNNGQNRQLIPKFFKTQRLYSNLQASYNFFWSASKKSNARRDDISKLFCFYELLEKMLVLDPRRRLPIEFVCADPFINDHQ